MRTVLGALVGYLSFMIIGAIALLALTSWTGLEAMVASGSAPIPALWLVIGLFVTGWVAGIAGKIAARVGERPEAALLLGVVIAIQGLSLLPTGVDSTGLRPAQVGLMSNLELLIHLQLPDWYARTLPLFAAAFIGYGGYLHSR